MESKVSRKYQNYPIFSTPIQQNIQTMLHAMSTPQSSQCQRMYTLYFPSQCTV